MLTSELKYAAKEFGERFALGDLACEVATKLTCSEVEALAAMLRATGYDYAAEYWIEDHAEADLCGDMHHLCEDCIDDEREEPGLPTSTPASKWTHRWRRWIGRE